MTKLKQLMLTAIRACGLLFILPALTARRGGEGKRAPGVLRAFGAVCLSGMLAIGNVAFAGAPASATGERQATDLRIDIAEESWEDILKWEVKNSYGWPDYLEKIDKKRGKDGWNFMHELTWRDRTKMMRRLIRDGANTGIKTDTRGWTPLHIAAHRNHADAMHILFVARANPNVRDNEGKTPLHIAAQNGHSHMMEMLLNERADYSIRDDMGRKPIHLVAMADSSNNKKNKERARMVDMLVAKGADRNARDIEGKTALVLAAERDNESMVSHLIEKVGVNRNKRDLNGYDALVHAARMGNDRTTNLLMKRYGFKKSILDKKGLDGARPLHVATQHNNRGGVRLLIKLGAKVNAPDQQGRSPLHWAAEYNSANAARELMDKGANKNARANWHYDGFTPFHIAAYRNSVDVAIALLDYGIGKWEKDTVDKPAYEYARWYHGGWSKIACYTWPHRAYKDEDCDERWD